MNAEAEKFIKLQDELKAQETKKIRLEEQFRTKKEMLTNLVKEIKEAGYEPNDLKKIIAEKETNLESMVNQFEEELKKTSEALSKIEG